MERKNKLICIGIMLAVFGVSQATIWFLSNPLVSDSNGKSKVIFFNYEDNIELGIDYAIEGAEFMYEALIGSTWVRQAPLTRITDALGQAVLEPVIGATGYRLTFMADFGYVGTFSWVDYADTPSEIEAPVPQIHVSVGISFKDIEVFIDDVLIDTLTTDASGELLFGMIEGTVAFTLDKLEPTVVVGTEDDVYIVLSIPDNLPKHINGKIGLSCYTDSI